jgi:hypothetical protein
VNDQKTTDELTQSWTATPEAKGQSLLIENADAQNKKLLLRFSLQKGDSYLILSECSLFCLIQILRPFRNTLFI